MFLRFTLVRSLGKLCCTVCYNFSDRTLSSFSPNIYVALGSFVTIFAICMYVLIIVRPSASRASQTGFQRSNPEPLNKILVSLSIILFLLITAVGGSLIFMRPYGILTVNGRIGSFVFCGHSLGLLPFTTPKAKHISPILGSEKI